MHNLFCLSCEKFLHEREIAPPSLSLLLSLPQHFNDDDNSSWVSARSTWPGSEVQAATLPVCHQIAIIYETPYTMGQAQGAGAGTGAGAGNISINSPPAPPPGAVQVAKLRFNVFQRTRSTRNY